MNDKALPAWDLSDLYDGIEDEKIAADLEKYGNWRLAATNENNPTMMM